MKVRNLILILLLLTSLIYQSAAIFQEPEARAVGLSWYVCLLTMLSAFAFRHPLHSILARRGLLIRRNFVLLGILGAVYVETVFLVLEKLTGAEGVAAHPNLLVDLLVTMPWYICMMLVFGRVYWCHRYSLQTVALLGGLYDFCADGILGSILSGTTITPAYLLLLLSQSGLFITVYAPIVLLPVLLFQEPQIQPSVLRRSRLPAAFLPLLPLLPYGLLVLLLFSE